MNILDPFKQFGAALSLIRAGYVLAREGALSVVPAQELPQFARFGLACARILERRSVRQTGRVVRLASALNRLGPSYVKFGQFLATRPDFVGADFAQDLAQLQDDMPPFPRTEVEKRLKAAFGEGWPDIFTDLSEPVAAASIAQVHRAKIIDDTGNTRDVAVKILRPDIEKRFARDMARFKAGAQLVERFSKTARRLRPVALIETLTRVVRLEMDLQLEAAAISEMAENIAGDDKFAVPDIFWTQTKRSVLTTSWVEGISLKDFAAMDAAGIDKRALGKNILEQFLRHAVRDGYFHADMHPGNLFVRPDGTLVAVDFGIMGRLSPTEQRFMAEMLYGFVSRDYERIARVHFDAGYVPGDESIADFAQFLRSVGEPLIGKMSRDMSMGDVLGQLLEGTDLFNMSTRTELVMLQKSMVVVEGVALTFDPDINIWTVAEPIMHDWIERHLGARGKIDDLASSAQALFGLAQRVPQLLVQAEAIVHGGLTLDTETIKAIGKAKRGGFWHQLPIWIGALALVGLALSQLH